MIGFQFDPNKLVLRPITEEDMEFLSDLYSSTRLEEMVASGWPQDQITTFLKQQFDAQHQHYQKHYPDANWDVIEYQNEAIGRLYLEEWPSQLRIIDIALLPNWRNKGIGGWYLNKVINQAKNLNKAVSIHVERNNPAMTLYKRLGFKKIEEKGVYDLLSLETHPIQKKSA